jgi:putative ABC transport system substrate-binding protein
MAQIGAFRGPAMSDEPAAQAHAMLERLFALLRWARSGWSGRSGICETRGGDQGAARGGAHDAGDGSLMRRRRVLAGLLLAIAAPLAAEAQPAGKVYRIGFLGNSTAALEAHLVGPFREGLRELGYVEGQNIVTEYRWAEGKYERFPALIAELLAQRVEVIVTAGTPASLAVKKATTSVPLIMVAVGDPVATGLVASLARPGGNITGLTSIAEETEGKRLELLREVIPRLSHVAALWNPENPTLLPQLKQMRDSAQVLGMKVQVLEVRTPGALEETFKAILRERPGALLVMGDRLFLHNRQRIMDFATAQRLPVVPVHPELVEAGGLMSFGPSYPGMHRRAAYFVDRILKGARPAHLPVERPARFELVINLKAAKALGLTIPPSLLARADQVIE